MPCETVGQANGVDQQPDFKVSLLGRFREIRGRDEHLLRVGDDEFRMETGLHGLVRLQ